MDRPARLAERVGTVTDRALSGARRRGSVRRPDGLSSLFGVVRSSTF